MVEETIEEIQSEYPEAELTVDIQSDTSVNADRGLRYAVNHALENAVVHDDHKTPIVTVVVKETAGQGEIQVIDSGPVIPDVEIKVLKEEVSTSTTYHGSGVGLWVMQ
ncbi:ATP-binding protein [Natronoglomus mannanivorans]|uniref:ATP-binding protein n=1 Tax=Natronoglomus mannanivorans TaxID=2979990 RepID=A0AAP3E583_9EURY|nr:ATP-binding protein [Halobacteria archaeon AArc-xg1-1]